LDFAGFPIGDAAGVEPFFDGEGGVGGEDGAGIYGIEEGVAERDVGAVAAGDDEIGGEVFAGCEEFEFGGDTGVAGEEDFPTAPVETEDGDAFIGEGVTGDGGRSVEELEVSAIRHGEGLDL